MSESVRTTLFIVFAVLLLFVITAGCLIAYERRSTAALLARSESEFRAWEAQMMRDLIATPGTEVFYDKDGNIEGVTAPGTLSPPGCVFHGDGFVTMPGSLACEERE